MNKLLTLFLAMIACTAFVSAGSWDKSSLSFTATNESCRIVSATVCNNGDGNMSTSTTYEVYYAQSGKPKEGDVVASGTIDPLKSGECTTLTYNPTEDGTYMFRAFQVAGHPGQGDLWSDAIDYDESNCQVPEFGVIAALVALLGAAGIILYRRH